MSDERCGDVCASDREGQHPCILEPGHSGSHRDISGGTWARPRSYVGGVPEDHFSAEELQDVAAGRKEWEAMERGTCGYMFCHNEYCVFNEGHALPHRDADGEPRE